MQDPQIYLAVDNCFAKKRWTRPSEWAELIRSMGAYYIEASADNECDPLFMGDEYMRRWQREVHEACADNGVRISNLFSGHGTYTTLGLAHPDKAIRSRIQNEWIKPMASLAAGLNAGIGFYCHAFAESVLQDPEAYRAAKQDLFGRLADLAQYCRSVGMQAPSVEQMYTPHQIPWTVAGSLELLAEVWQQSGGAPFYLTLDTGHQSGQRKFMRPSDAVMKEAAGRIINREEQTTIWLGPQTAFRLFAEMGQQPVEREQEYIALINKEMDRFPHLFAAPIDGDTYYWLENLGCYSPILHLQQTAGFSSSHLPFTEEHNRKGIIFAEPLFQAIARSYSSTNDDVTAGPLPPKCSHLYLTLEIFSGTADYNVDIIGQIRQSIAYWRKYIPEDGMRLSEILQLIGKQA